MESSSVPPANCLLAKAARRSGARLGNRAQVWLFKATSSSIWRHKRASVLESLAACGGAGGLRFPPAAAAGALEGWPLLDDMAARRGQLIGQWCEAAGGC